MTQKTEALRLADLLEETPDSDGHCRQAAAELRRLQSVETESKERILRLEGALTKEVAINAQLLEALEFVMTAHGEQLSTAFEQAQDAIAAAKGEA